MKEYQPKNIAGKLAQISILNPITPFLIILLLIVGAVILTIMPREENPQIVVSGGVVILPMPGLDAKEIKKVIVEPFEKKIREIKGVENIISSSKDDVGIITVYYYMGTDKESADQKLYDIVMQNIDILPKGAMMPLIKPLDIDNDLPIMTIALYPLDETVSLDKLYEKAREFERIIGSVENVSKVIIKGGRKSQYNILVDLHKLSGFHISLAQVVDALESLTTNTPSISAPSVDASSNVLIGIENSLHDVKDIKNLIVANYQGSVIYLKDIATVQKGIDIQNKKVAWISFKRGRS
jgi:multidrug efflux pump subunit AcrB